MKMKRNTSAYRIFLIANILFLSTYLFAQKGTLDSSFGINGKIILGISSGSSRIYNQARAVGLQSNQKIIIAVNLNTNVDSFALIRFKTNGFIDSTFGINGIARISLEAPSLLYADSRATCLYIQPDDKILVGGNAESSSIMGLVRFNANGFPDSSFGKNGIQKISFSNYLEVVNKVSMQSNGKIILTGTYYDFYNRTSIGIARFNSNGKLDSSFGVNGKINQSVFSTGNTSVNAIAILPNDKILVTGFADSTEHFSHADNTYTLLLRFSKNGKLDSSFGKNGITLTNADDLHSGVYPSIFYSAGYGIAVSNDGKIITSGIAYAQAETRNSELIDFATIRYLPNGTVDSSFAVNGIARSTASNLDYHAAYAVKIMPDGDILAAGEGGRTEPKTDFCAIAYKSSGTPDKAFGKKGIVRTNMIKYNEYAIDIAVQKDNKFILAGVTRDSVLADNFYIALARYNYIVPASQQIAAKNLAAESKTTTVKYYPNPVNDVLHIEGITVNTRLIVTDNNGKTIKQTVPAGEVYHYNTTSLPAGIYYLRIVTSVKTETLKFIKQ